ncbi:MAG: M64 family metallopeptidase [Chitinophagales bacterium]
MNKTLLILTLFVVFVLNSFTSNAQVIKVDTLIYNGSPTNRINILIMGDGYKSTQMAKFRSDAMINANYLINTPPFDDYADFFNFFAVEVASTDTSIDHPGNGSDEATYVGHTIGPVQTKNTYLNCTFDYLASVHRLIASTTNSTITSIATSNFPQYDYITVIANTAYYGGSGGTISFASMDVDATEIFIHEFGHSFGLLQDEYGGSTCTATSVQKINTSGVGDSNVVWKNWLPRPLASFPTPALTSCGTIGVYVGGDICNTNRYHPKCYCKMRVLGEDFCEVCKEQLVYRIDTSVSYIDATVPSGTTATVCKNSTHPFSVSLLNNASGTVRAQWFVDGTLVTNNSTTFNLNTTTYGVGSHTVKLVTQDTSSLSKKRLAVYTKTWTVTVSNTNPVTAGATPSTSFCVGTNISLTASGATGYNWSKQGGSYTSTTQNPVITNPVLADSGTYIVNATGTCASQGSVKITMKPLPTITIGSNSPVLQSDTIKLTATGGTSYVWTGPTSYSSGIQNAKRTGLLLADSGFYKVVVTNNGCSRTDSVKVRLLASFLPVELTEFSGKTENDINILSWVTASELNNDYFEVQRSSDAEEWTAIGTVKGHGTCRVANSYELNDDQPNNGINYYRLKQVDFDGKFNYSHVIALNNTVTQETEVKNIIIYPNPARSEIWLKTDMDIAENKEVKIQLLNYLGEKIYDTSLNENLQKINLSDYLSGLYFLQIGHKTYKIIKE